MELEQLPESTTKVHRSLKPYVKSRQDASQIRRVLALHLSSQVNQAGDAPLLRPLSLVDPERSVEASPHGFRGLQKEYLRCVKANLKAKNEYEKVRRAHHSQQEDSTASKMTKSSEEPGHHIESFIDLVKHRQVHERLRIIQDYIDMLAQKPAAAADHLDSYMILRDVETLPKIPQEILSNSGPVSGSDGKDLEALVDQLEKSVLRAKLLLKKEQKFLAKVQAENRNSSNGYQGHLQALGETRNELINWIETELANAGETPEDSPVLQNPGRREKDFIDAQLVSIQRQYAQYTKARGALLSTVTESSDLSPAAKSDENAAISPLKEPVASSGMAVVYPYLEEMIAVSTEQKAMIQQKSHITISLAKQLKEARQGLDRLAHESHLLPLYPMPAVVSQRKGLEGPISFSEEISNYEKPDSSHQARAWVYATESAGAATKDSISERLEEGGRVVGAAQQKLLSLQRLLGMDGPSSERGQEPVAGGQEKGGRSRDIWAVLDGNLGVINGDGDDAE